MFTAAVECELAKDGNYGVATFLEATVGLLACLSVSQAAGFLFTSYEFPWVTNNTPRIF